MLDKKEIKERLKGLPSEFAVAFAVRAAMRVLPLVADNQRAEEPFWFWKKQQAMHLFAALHRQRIAYARSFLNDELLVQLASKVGRYADWSATFAASVPFDPDAAYLTYAVDTADAAANAVLHAGTSYSAKFESQTLTDLNSIAPSKGFSPSSPHFLGTYVDFLQKPLWSEGPPEDWTHRWQFFNTAVLNIEPGFSGFLDWFDARIAGKPIDRKFLIRQVFIPDEILAQDIPSILAYLNSLDRAEKTLNRVRAIFIGHGEAGKSSLVRCLFREPVIEGKEAMTPGIAIREWPLPNSDVRVHFWDFGGQVIAHATHQFFLRSRCLYVLVMDARAEIHANEQAQYWLEHVKAFAGDAPVLLVGNKADQVRINLDMGSLQERYRNIVGFYALSCTHYQDTHRLEYEVFERDFIEQCERLDLHQVRFLNEHFGAMEFLRERSSQKAFLSEQEFESICNGAGVRKNSELNQAWLLDTLDKLGVVLHFPDLTFHDAFVLNPRWLTYAVYTLIYSQQAAGHGELTMSQVIEILQQERVVDEQGQMLDYPKEKCGFIVEAMQRFKLCYFLNESRERIVIPDLLSPNQPELDFDRDAPGIGFEFHFRHFLPRHVLPAFIVSRHREIEDRKVWQTGVLLKSQAHAARSLVRVNYSDRVISIDLQGRDANVYLHILHDEVMGILRKLAGIEVEERVRLPRDCAIDSRSFVQRDEYGDYRQMLATLRLGQRIYISSTGGQYDLYKIMGLIMTDEKLKQEAGDQFVIHNGNVVINKGHMQQTAVGGNLQIAQAADALADEVRELIRTLKVEIEPGETKDKAIRELEVLRDDIAEMSNADSGDRKEAVNGLRKMAENLESGLGHTARVTEGLSGVADKVLGLADQINRLLHLLPF